MTVSSEVTVSRGEDAILSCSFRPEGVAYTGGITVKWLARERKAAPFFQCSLKNDSVGASNPCLVSGLRYSLNGDPRRGELSLLIRKVQLTDGGVFFCRVEVDRAVTWLGGSHLMEEILLHVNAEPQILSISVVDAPCSPGSSAPSWLQCEVEGNPPPKVIWLSASRRMLENQGRTSESGPYRRSSCVPYLQEEGQVLTCRAESRLGEAERRFPDADVLMFILIVCGGVLLMIAAVTVILIYCLKKNRRQQSTNSPTDGAQELQMVYSEITFASMNSRVPTQQQAGVTYSPLKLQL
ncbi:sialic acid binding Ig-like lectin 15, like [Odontesthes bonariensis]|uniref:sialic acid binding Ig-like lectin 15, like n=1 Tax=Odontesthes bonariensis TaxID=219752 RepID=UPI003F58D059